MSAIKLSKWSVVVNGSNPYKEPKIRLGGIVSGHPDYPDGKDVVTSKIMTANGRSITVESGRVYELIGDPDFMYATYLASIGKVYDPVNPIKVIQVKPSKGEPS